MAIPESQPHIEVRVLVQGQPATEYNDNSSEHIAPLTANQEQEISADNAVIKYIESISDATFKIHLNAF